MIGIVLVTHARLGEEFIAATEHVVGPQKKMAAICIGPHDDVEAKRQDIVKAVEDVNDGSGVVIISDMFGGTPSNLAISVMKEGEVEVVAGANLPMLIKLASIRDSKPLKEAIEIAQEAGKKYINVASNLLG